VFSGCGNLVSIVLPESMDNIPMSFFKDCVKLKEIKIPENVMSINERAFKGCIALKKLDIPYLLEEVLDEAFMNCISLKKIVFLRKCITSLLLCLRIAQPSGESTWKEKLASSTTGHSLDALL